MLIHIDNNRTMEVKYLGKGMFSKAYLSGSVVYVINYREDPSKECLALFCQDLSVHIPKVKYLGYNGKDQQCFIMPYYAKLRVSHKEAWRQGKVLRKYIQSIQPYNTKDRFISIFLDGLNGLPLPDYLIEALETIANNSMNYGEDGSIECNPGNLGIDEEENLVLRDILCFRSSIDKARPRKYHSRF